MLHEKNDHSMARSWWTGNVLQGAYVNGDFMPRSGEINPRLSRQAIVVHAQVDPTQRATGTSSRVEKPGQRHLRYATVRFTRKCERRPSGTAPLRPM
jgi:hypothetical protein